MNRIIKEDYDSIIDGIDIYEFADKVFFITGATGFIGGHLVDFLMYLNEKHPFCNCRVIALCRNSVKASKRFLQYKNDKRFSLLTSDFSEELKISPDIDYIIHAASISNTKEFEKMPVDLLVSNIVGTWKLLEITKNKSAKLLFLSSGAVYGEYTDDEMIIDEDSLFVNNYISPGSSYSTGKRGGEAFCRAYTCQYGTDTVIARISHTYGPLIDLYDGKVFSDFVRNIIHNEDLLIKSDGLAYRPYCYISDTIKALFFLLFFGKSGEAYNVANPKETYTVRELAELLVSNVFPEKNLRVKYLKGQVNDTTNSLNKEKVYVSINKINKLGWTPVTTVEEGFQRTVNCFGELI